MSAKRILALLAAVALLAGCNKAAESTTKAGLDFQVDKLFTVDGCSVYRFADGGRSRYFTNCSGSTEWAENCGKNCTQEQGVDGGHYRKP